MRQLDARVVQLAVVDQDLRRLVPDLRVLRIELHEAAIADHRFLILAERAVRVGHVDHDEVVVGLELERALVAIDRARVVVAAVVLIAHHEPRVDHLGIVVDDALQRAQSFVRLLVVARDLAGLRHEVEELNLVFRVREARAIGRRGGEERADVAERGEPLARFRIDFNRRLRRGRVRRHPRLEREQLLVQPIAERLPLRVDVF